MEVNNLIERLHCPGSETLLVSFDKAGGRIYYGGSSDGELFIEQNQLVEKFHSFLTENYHASNTSKDHRQPGLRLNIKVLDEDTSLCTESENAATEEKAKDATTKLVGNSVSYDSQSVFASPLSGNIDDDGNEVVKKEERAKAGTIDTCEASVVNISKTNRKSIGKSRRKCVLSRPTTRSRTKTTNPSGKMIDSIPLLTASNKRRISTATQNTEGTAEDKGVVENAEKGKQDMVVEAKEGAMKQLKTKAKSERSKPIGKVKEESALSEKDDLKGCVIVDNANKLQNSEVVGTIGEETRKDNPNTKKNVCNICGKKLRHISSLSRHIRDVHNGKSFCCYICFSRFDTHAKLRKHSLVHRKEDGNFVCLKCGLIFQVKQKYFRHVGEMHKKEKMPLVRICTICNVKFVNISGYLRHMKCHESLKVFKCYVCQISFHSMRELDDHVTTHSLSLTFKCSECGKIFQSSDQLNYHTQNFCHAKKNDLESNREGNVKNVEKTPDSDYVNEKNLPLDMDGQNSAREKSEGCYKDADESISGKDEGIKTEEKREGGESSNSSTWTENMIEGSKYCSEDRKEESTENSLAVKFSQAKASRNPDGHVCDLCGQKFKFSIALFKHKLLHDEKGLFPCRFCSWTFSSFERLSRHARTHSQKESFKCEVCKKVYYTKNGLTVHLRSNECTSNRKPFQCEECGKCFTSNFILQRHKNNHTGERPFKCQYCDKSFISMETASCHENTHTKKRTYMCDICGLVFYRKCSLYTHKKIHNEVKEHVCTKCGKKCRTHGALKTHYVSKHLTPEEFTHYKHKVYQCSTCQKFFADKSDLVNHERVHTGERPFACSKCGKTFADKSNMRTHEKTHLEVKPYPCQYCEKGFILNRDLKRHIKNHHEDNPSPTPPKRSFPTKQKQVKLIDSNEIEEQRQREIKVQVDHLTNREGMLDISRGSELVPHYMASVSGEGGYGHVTHAQGYGEQVVEYGDNTNAPAADTNFILIL